MYVSLRKREFSNLNMNLVCLSGSMDTERGVECGICIESRSVEEAVSYGRFKHILGWNLRETEGSISCVFIKEGEKWQASLAEEESEVGTRLPADR